MKVNEYGKYTILLDWLQQQEHKFDDFLSRKELEEKAEQLDLKNPFYKYIRHDKLVSEGPVRPRLRHYRGSDD